MYFSAVLDDNETIVSYGGELHSSILSNGVLAILAAVECVYFAHYRVYTGLDSGPGCDTLRAISTVCVTLVEFSLLRFYVFSVNLLLHSRLLKHRCKYHCHSFKN